MPINLQECVKAFLVKYSNKEAAEIVGKPPAIVHTWSQGKFPSMPDIQAMMDKEPGMFGGGDVAPIAPYEFKAGTKVCILMPTNRPIHSGVLRSFAYLYEREKMQFYTSNDTSIVRARNICAQKFLNSNCEYSFWLDDDTILPHGDLEYYRKVSDNSNFPAAYVNINPIARLMQTNHSLVGGCYFGRNPTGVAQFQEAYQSTIVNNAAHSGPRNAVDPVGWIGFGCTLVHRKVFEDIVKTQPEVAITDQGFISRFGYTNRFFNYVSEEHSEDASFCIRAKRAGHQAYVDYAVMPIHMGEAGYCYHNTAQKKYFAPQY
jgi:hypothetical protein